MMKDVGCHSAASSYVCLGVCIYLVDKRRRKSALEKAI